jgi:hypothetical protein
MLRWTINTISSSPKKYADDHDIELKIYATILKCFILTKYNSQNKYLKFVIDRYRHGFEHGFYCYDISEFEKINDEYEKCSKENTV